jgi:phosphoribosylaminoimidazolecarboxamide formyltransferase/IMP cyclohydrolase/phosphoribosylaminoimidazolecarboxamide formyltransferase
MSSYGDFIALSDVCDRETASIILPEVSDGIVAPGYTEEALAILKRKRKGSYTIIKIDEDYEPRQIERKDVYGITFEQKRNDYRVDENIFNNIVTKNTDLSESARLDLMISLITLKYTQSNSVCYVYDGQAIGIGAGQQSRIHCTRLAGGKADTWFLRQHEKTLNLKFKKGVGRADRDNTIDVYLSEYWEDLLMTDAWKDFFEEKPEPLTDKEKREYLSKISGVSLGSDAFFPFGDNIERAAKSGVSFVVQPGGSIRDDNVIEACDRYGIVMAFTGMRLFHH